MSGADPNSQQARQWRYQALLRTLAYNSGDPQPVMCEAGTLWTTLVANGNLRHGEAKKALQAALDNGHVVRWTNADGRYCYGITTDGVDAVAELDRSEFGPADETGLRETIAVEASREDPDKDVIGWANTWLQTLEGV